MSEPEPRRTPDRTQAPPRRVLITGAGGLVGSSVVPFLSASGHEVWRLARPDRARSSGHAPRLPASPGTGSGNASAATTLTWDPALGILDPRPLEGVDAVIHLAGENIAAARWTQETKERILRSRVVGTRLLSERLAALTRRPEALICASAIGLYGDRGAEEIDETAGPGTGFLASVVQAWEDAAAPARAAGIRVVHLRLAAVLAPGGGALSRLLPLFRLGLGGRLGSGRQYFSWIALDDLLRSIEWTLSHPSLHGPVNAAAPEPVTNREFTRTLARVLGKPAPFAVPGWALRLGLGEMAEEMLLRGARVTPARLQASGFAFAYPALEPALRHLLEGADV